MNLEKYCFLILVALFYIGCNAQNTTSTNEIVQSEGHLFGVKSANGKLLIDTIFGEIRVLDENSRLTLPPSTKRVPPKLTEYYLVTDIERKKAIFDKDGKLVFGFMACFMLQYDKHSQAIVATKAQANNQLRSFLYDLEGNLIFDTSFESIAFINSSDLIALIVADGAHDEYYLYNPSTKDKIGPFDHFNIYNEDSNVPFGMELQEFEKYRQLNIVAVRQTVDNDYLWGVYDLSGNEILPIEYKNLKKLSEVDKNHNAYKNAKKPEGVDFLFKCSHRSQPSKAVYFDSNFHKYQHKIISIPNGEYLIERI